MKKGIELLKLNKEELEYSSTTIPQSYLNFANKYQLGEGSFNNEIVRKTDIDFEIPLTNVVVSIENFEIELDYFYTIEHVHLLISRGEYENDPSANYSFVKIAALNFPSNSNLYLSLTENLKNEIYIGWYTLNNVEKFSMLSKDIIELAHQLKSKINRYQVNEKTSSLLYKNWGENFWRIREEKEEV